MSKRSLALLVEDIWQILEKDLPTFKASLKSIRSPLDS